MSPSSSRDRLLDAAEQLMHAHGFEAVGVAELCATADVPKGSFYHWWPSKQALAVAMLERSWARMRDRLYEPVFGDDRAFGEQLDAYAAGLRDVLQRHLRETGQVRGCPYGNLCAELAARDEAIRDASAEIFARMQCYFVTAIERAQARGELGVTVPAAGAAVAICSLMEGLMILAKSANDPDVVMTLADSGRLVVGLPPRAAT